MSAPTDAHSQTLRSLAEQIAAIRPDADKIYNALSDTVATTLSAVVTEARGIGEVLAGVLVERDKLRAELVALKALYSGAVEGRAVLLQQIATGVSRTEHNETIAELVAERRRTDFLLEKCGLTERATVDAAIAKELGWTTRAVPDEWSSGEPSEVVIWVAPDGASWNLPKFTSDLNAIHQAIMTRIVRGKSIAQYMSNEHLFEAKLCAISEREQVPVWHFTAELYAEAFLAAVDTARPAEIAANATPPETNP